MAYKYSVITFNFNDYEIVHEVMAKDEDVEYILVTDNPTLTSNTWNILYRPNLGVGGFEKSFYVRYHPFEFCTTDLCFLIDGSMGLQKSLHPIADKMNETKSDLCLTLHPQRETAFQELHAWKGYERISKENIQEQLYWFFENWIDYETYRGLVQTGFMVQRKCTRVQELCDKMWNWLCDHRMNDGDVHRLDQTIFSIMLREYEPLIPITFVTADIFENLENNNHFLTLFWHASDSVAIPEISITNYHFFDKPVEPIIFD